MDFRLELLLAQSHGGVKAPGPLAYVVVLTIIVVYFLGIWRTFTKAGKPGWACLVPIYNFVVMLRIARMSAWWVILIFIPVINLMVLLTLGCAIAERFDKGQLFGFGLTFLPFVFFPILGFGDAQYERSNDAAARQLLAARGIRRIR